LQRLFKITSDFQIAGEITSVNRYGNGNINDSYLVTTNCPQQKKYILQKINAHVFLKPDLLMQNICTVTEHIENKLTDSHKWQVFSVVKTKSGHGFHVSDKGSHWRMISFIEDSESFDVIQSDAQAYKLGSALGVFHSLVSDLSPDRLATVLDGFHVTPCYLKHYDQVIKRTPFSDEINFHIASAEAAPSSQLDLMITQLKSYACNFIVNNRSLATVLETAKEGRILSLRIMHGDPKINNVMFHKITGDAISIIDLDTVEPGLIQYDIGDCIRSSCNTLGEEAGEQWQDVTFDIEKFRCILQGYISEAKNFLTADDYDYLYHAIFTITFELGLRFFTDYLEGNSYFSKIDYEEQNLFRGLTQFKLAESIQTNRNKIEKIIMQLYKETKAGKK